MMISSLLVRAATAILTYDSSSFLLDGKPFKILGGQIDPQRVPMPYWAARLDAAKAMGLNTIFSYVFWNEIEIVQGEYQFGNLSNWASLVTDKGLQWVLRPGPYVCGERDWGGLPFWLYNAKVRSSDRSFLEPAIKYLEALGAHLGNTRPAMVQIENEYGAFGSDKVYLQSLVTALKRLFPQSVLYTNDAGDLRQLASGRIEGALQEIDGDPHIGWPLLTTGPKITGEWYVRWFDYWGGEHQMVRDVDAKARELTWMINNGNGFSLYMFHGGTNLGFSNGAIDLQGPLQPFTTSYDYGAPLDESGRTTVLYEALRKALGGPGLTVPPLRTYPSIELDRVGGLAYKVLHSADDPLTFEELGTGFGFVMYEHTASSDLSGSLLLKPRDRVIVYVNGVEKGVFDATLKDQPALQVSLQVNDSLSLLVENLGRVDYGGGINSPRKGLVGDVTIGGHKVVGWRMSLPDLSTPSTNEDVGGPAFYRGLLRLDDSPKGMTEDTFLGVGGTKGVVFVNGINLGRYWSIGPQQDFYLPACYLNKNENDILVLELHPSQAVRTLTFSSTRTWKGRA
ncbi:hypothetical protein PYCC9005_003038 [Savitreella phatthalungensis]